MRGEPADKGGRQSIVTVQPSTAVFMGPRDKREDDGCWV